MSSLHLNHVHVNLQIEHSFIVQVIDFLIENKIHFLVNYAPQTPPTDKVPEKNIPVSLLKQPLAGELKSGTMQTVYQKYIVDAIENPPVKVKMIAFELGITEDKFNYTFKGYFGKPFYQLYMEKRMEHAAKLLRQGFKCYEVSTKVGYRKGSRIKFSKMFQKHFNITPKKYQQSIKSV